MFYNMYRVAPFLSCRQYHAEKSKARLLCFSVPSLPLLCCVTYNKSKEILCLGCEPGIHKSVMPGPLLKNNTTTLKDNSMTANKDLFGARTTLQGVSRKITYFHLDALTQRGVKGIDRLPFTVKIILENALRYAGGELVTEDDVLSLARWEPGQASKLEAEYPYLPARVLLQDFTGVPAVADLAAMRSAVARMHGDPQKVNPLVPADLVIDHSVQVDMFGSTLAFARNVEREYERNSERYALLR